MAGVVRYEVDGYVAVLTLNRPEVLNAVNSALADAVGGCLEDAAADPGVSEPLIAAAAGGVVVNDVVPASGVLPRALELARRIAENAPISVQYAKKVLYQTASAGSDRDPAWNGGDPWQVNAEATAVVFASGDAVEGATAFAEKRPPVWTGK